MNPNPQNLIPFHTQVTQYIILRYKKEFLRSPPVEKIPVVLQDTSETNKRCVRRFKVSALNTLISVLKRNNRFVIPTEDDFQSFRESVDNNGKNSSDSDDGSK